MLYHLNNGMQLVYEYMPNVKSVSVGIWVRAGSMYEKKSESGISHFIEHMLFKGTQKRSAKRIAEEIDSVGGQINAYTARECTCYYSRTLGESLELLIDILSDMYYNSLFSESDINLERKVIIEEINMYEDSPEDLVLDRLEENMWKDNSLGFSISGTRESVFGITRENIIDYYKRRYTPENTVISVAGCFDEKELISLCEKYFSEGQKGEDFVYNAPVFNSGKWEIQKDIEQTHIAIGYEAYDLSSDKIYALSVMNNIFGGSMSSRLFQSVRENHGLCYSIYSYTGVFPTAGMLGIYTGVSPEEAEKTLEMIDEETNLLLKNGVRDEELKRVCNQMKCSVLMARESVSARMSENGKSQLLLGRIRTDDEITKIIDSLKKDDIMKVAEDVFNSDKKAAYIIRGGLK